MHYGFVSGYRGAGPISAQQSTEAQSDARRANAAVEQVADLLARHALVLKTLLTFCEQKGMFKEPEFLKLMEDIDLSDGVADGRYKPQGQPRQCVACGRNNRRTAMRCMYCGEAIADRDVM
jgi:hypothetical protein